MTSPLCVVALYKQPTSTEHGESPFWSKDQWGPTYTKRLIRGVNRGLASVPWFFTLMTDTPTIWAPCCADAKLPVSLVPLVSDAKGWFAKNEMYRPEVSEGKTLYLDLDNVVCGDLSGLAALTPDPLIMMDDRVYPRSPNGSTMLFDANHPTMRALWTEYAANPQAIEREFAGDWPNQSDQAFVADRVKRAGHAIPFFQDLLPNGYILNSRCELETGADWSNCHLVYGSHLPKPHESKHPLYAKHWT